MRGRAVLSLFLLLFSSYSVLAQCSWTPRLSIPFRTSALDVSADGSHVWVATSYGIQLLQNDGSRILGSIPLPGVTRTVVADGRGNAYAGSGSRLYVLRGAPNGVSVVRSVDAGATVNDILISGSYLFVGTSTGLAHFDVIDPVTPIRTSAILPTSSPNVTSLAAAGTKLFAADNDTSLEVFTISIPSIPQRTGELETLRAAAVHASADGTLYVSDAVGLNTDVFTSGTTKIARLGTGSNAFASGANGVHYAAGPDRTIRAIDFTSTAVVKERFEIQLTPTAGNDNVIHAMARSGNRLFVAAGDIGLAVVDTTSVAPPYPVVGYRSGPTTSVAVSGDRAWFADGSGTITEQKIDTNGIALSSERTWAGGALVHDVEGSTLLASTGAKATRWTLGATPVVASEITFPSAIRTAALGPDNTVIALLQDGTVRVGEQLLSLPPIAYLGSSGSAVVFVQLTSDGKTVLHRYGSLAKTTINGSAVGGVGVGASEAVVFTFAGLNLVDLASGAVHVIPDSHRVIPRQLAISGEHVLLLDRRTLYVFGRNGLLREQPLPADATLLDARSGIAVLATNEGTSAVSYLSQQPAVTMGFASSFYTKLATLGDRLYLLAGDSIDIYSDTTRFEKKVGVAGLLDLTTTGNALFTLTASGTVTAYSPSGVASAQVTIDEGSDAQMLAIDGVGNAVWVSLAKGCLAGACQKKTLVLDPATLNVTATLTGGVADVVTSGGRAYALVELPAEMRVLNIADPLHPAQVIAATAPASATSLAAYSGRVYVAADRLYEYFESTLLAKATHLSAVTADKSQQVRVDGNCLLITARGPNPEAYDANALAPSATFEVPANVRMMSVQPGKVTLLTTHSIEVWSTTAPAREKRRATR